MRYSAQLVVGKALIGSKTQGIMQLCREATSRCCLLSQLSLYELSFRSAFLNSSTAECALIEGRRSTILSCLVRLYLYQYTLSDIEHCNTVHNV